MVPTCGGQCTVIMQSANHNYFSILRGAPILTNRFLCKSLAACSAPLRLQLRPHLANLSTEAKGVFGHFESVAGAASVGDLPGAEKRGIVQKQAHGPNGWQLMSVFL